MPRSCARLEYHSVRNVIVELILMLNSCVCGYIQCSCMADGCGFMFVHYRRPLLVDFLVGNVQFCPLSRIESVRSWEVKLYTRGGHYEITRDQEG